MITPPVLWAAVGVVLGALLGFAIARARDRQRQLRDRITSYNVCYTKLLRVAVEARETLNYRVREAETQKVPYMAVIGEREAALERMSQRAFACYREKIYDNPDILSYFEQATPVREFA